MIKWFLGMGARRFGARYNYDTSYMSYITDASAAAGLRLTALQVFSQYSGPKEARDVWAGAMISSTLEGDCGPCVQLVADMALDAGVPARQLALCLQGKPDAAGDVGLGFRFARAAIEGHPNLNVLRSEIERRFGRTAIIAATFAAASGRNYPVLKRGLGFGQTCSKVTIGDEMIGVSHPQ